MFRVVLDLYHAKMISSNCICQARAAYGTLRKHGLSLPVTISRGRAGDYEQYPFIKPSDFIRCMDKTNSLKMIFGTACVETIEPALHVFWSRYRAICPNHDVFKMADSQQLVLSRTLPYFLHADEGRTLKKKAIFLLQWQVAFGKGVGNRRSAEEINKNLAELNLQPNYKGNSLSTRFLAAMMLRSEYQDTPERLEELLEHVVTDLASLGREGIEVSQGRIWLAPLGNKGDWSYLVDIANLSRSYRNGPKGQNSKVPNRGVCHLCYAGYDGYPYEDVLLVLTCASFLI